MMRRREFVGGLGAGGFAALVPAQTKSATTLKRVVIVGGGMAGATAAKYLRLWSNKTIDVTLIAPNSQYVSNIMSNLVVTSQVTYDKLLFSYTDLTTKYGVKILKGTVDTVTKTPSGGRVEGFLTDTPTRRFSNECERVVLAPGIQMDDIPLTPLTGGGIGSGAPILHAWQAGQQTQDLQTLLAGMQGGQSFILSIPLAPYRCPPGPYERACVIADYLLRNKNSPMQAKIYVLDANPDFVAEPVNFSVAFNKYKAAGVLEHIQNAKIDSVAYSAKAGSNQDVKFTVTDPISKIGTPYVIHGDVVNIIPPHRAPDLLKNAGLLIGNDPFAAVDVRTYESLVPGMGNFHIIGDAAFTSLPKAGHVGNQEAKICAAAIIKRFAGGAVDQAPTANSACFSPIDSTQASWLSAVYQYDSRIVDLNKRMIIWNGTGDLGAVGTKVATEASAPTTDNFAKMQKWYSVLMSDTFT